MRLLRQVSNFNGRASDSVDRFSDNETELLRRHSVTTKMLSAYARWNGGYYLRSTIQKTVEKLIKSSDKLNLELDPSRSASPEELHQNALQLQTVTEMFIDEICNSADRIPATFGRICHTIAVAVTPRFPEAKFTAVGAFIFLRYFCPAIVAPDAEGLIMSAPSKEMRRGLLLIAKVVQNLANNVLFGTKEQYMSPLNDFLAQNIYRVTAFLRDISVRFSSSLHAQDKLIYWPVGKTSYYRGYPTPGIFRFWILCRPSSISV